MKQYCETCALYIPWARSCQIMSPLLQGKIKVNDYCTQYRSFLHRCERCGNGTLAPIIEAIDGITHIYCENCAH